MVQQREATQRMEDAKYRALGYFKHRIHQDGGNNPGGGGAGGEEGNFMPQKPPPRPIEEITYVIEGNVVFRKICL